MKLNITFTKMMKQHIITTYSTDNIQIQITCIGKCRYKYKYSHKYEGKYRYKCKQKYREIYNYSPNHKYKYRYPSVADLKVYQVISQN